MYTFDSRRNWGTEAAWFTILNQHRHEYRLRLSCLQYRHLVLGSRQLKPNQSVINWQAVFLLSQVL